MTSSRTLQTVLFTDIVESTQKAAALGDAAWSNVLRHYHDIVGHEVARRGGEIAGSTGDGTVAIFEGPTPAILAALAIREALRKHELEIRAGIHMGEVIRTGTTIEGIGVHIGARVAGEAAPGEVLVSSTVHDAEAGSDFGFEDRGVHALKGVPGEWRLYVVTRGPRDAPAEVLRRPWRVPRRRAIPIVVVAVAVLAAVAYVAFGDRGDLAPEDVVARAAEPGIAILPFTVNDPELERWREGMVDLLSTNLDGVAGLRAIDSRTVHSQWREAVSEGETADLATALRVARDTGARYGLLGSVVGSESDIRLVAEVYDLDDGQRSLGEEQVQGPPDSIFGLIDRLSIALLDRILEEEGNSAGIDLSEITTTSVPALKAFLEGESLLRRSRFGEATTALERAVAADSAFALAWFRLAESAAWIENIGVTSTGVEGADERAWKLRERLPQRERRLLEVTAAERRLASPDATQLARDATNEYPDDPRAWYLLGEALYHRSYQTSPNRAEREEPFRRAVELDPLFTPAYIHLVDIAFQYADSATVARLLAGYGRGAGGSPFVQQYQLAMELAWGAPSDRRFSEALDAVSSADMARAISLLGHPRFLEVQERLLVEFGRRPDVSREFANGIAIENRLRQGKLRGAIEIAFDPVTDLDDRLFTLWQLHLFERGGLLQSSPISELDLDREFSLPNRADTLYPGRLFRAAAYAIDRGRERDYEDAIRALQIRMDAARIAGDSVDARDASAALQGAQGYEAASRQRFAEAARLLGEAYRASGLLSLRLPLLLALVRGDFADEVSLYLSAQAPDPIAGSLAGPLLENAGRRDEALEAWQWVLEAWADADPELQPRVEMARRGIGRLRGDDPIAARS